jgi:hypothetical protein
MRMLRNPGYLKGKGLTLATVRGKDLLQSREKRDGGLCLSYGRTLWYAALCLLMVVCWYLFSQYT